MACKQDSVDDIVQVTDDYDDRSSYIDESEMRRELLADRWRQIFDKSRYGADVSWIDGRFLFVDGERICTASLRLELSPPPVFPAMEHFEAEEVSINFQYDPEGFGEIPWDDFLKVLQTPEFREEIAEHKIQILQDKAAERKTTSITFQDFVNVMTGKRTRSFKCAVHHRDREICSENDYHLIEKEPTCFQKMVKIIADEYLIEERDRKYYADNYRCCPPPWFIIFVTLLELGFFTYYTIVNGEVNPSGPVPIDSIFIYRPDKRDEVWRFLFYMVLHSGWLHLIFNLFVQLLVGLPLEMVHGSTRIGVVYMSGVLAGSLGTSVFDRDVYLVGASGGVYALLAAHLANVLLNYYHMEFGILRLVGIFVVASADVGFAIYDRYAAEQLLGPPVSYVSHLTGALAGLTIGFIVLKNFEQKLHEQLIWWIALGVYAACTLFAILYNIFTPYPYP